MTRFLLLLAVFPALAFSQKVSIEFDEARDFSDFQLQGLLRPCS